LSTFKPKKPPIFNHFPHFPHLTIVDNYVDKYSPR
jgi:hypothetical protein